MAGSVLKKSSAFGAIAAMLALAVVPTAASAQEVEDRADGLREQSEPSGDVGGGSFRVQREARQEARAEQRAERVEQRQAAAQAPEQAEPPRQPSFGGGGWRGRGDATVQIDQPPQPQQAAPSWGSQRPGDGPHRGRDRANGGAVDRPVPVEQQAGAPPIPQRGEVRDGSRWSGRNGTYRDADRDHSHDRDRRQHDGWSGNRTEHADWGDRYRNDDRTAWGSPRGYNDRRHQRWDRHDWRRDNRYNWSNYRNHNRITFSIGSYYSPYRNYSYRPLSVGYLLNSLFYSNRYWINDPYRYRLPEVYGPYRWVRYYDDVLLVDIYSGEVLDVIRDFFW